MYTNKSIIKIINKKFFLNEFIFIIKAHKDNYEVLVIDGLNKRVYLEDNYPISLLEESKVREYAKKEFLDELNYETKNILIANFSDFFNEISSYDEQKSLF